MKKNRFRHAFISSFMSLILCCAMLISTTYAWMTDSVSSGETRIVAGTLDFDLLMADTDPGTTEYKSIAGNTGNLFRATDWEPNDTESVLFAVKNNGNLPLKYTVGLVVKDTGLAEFLEYSIYFENADTDSTKQKQASEQWHSLASASNATVVDNISYMTISQERTLDSNSDNTVSGMVETIDPFSLSIRMKGFENKEQISDYQDAYCEIDLRIVATQDISEVEEESDSYGIDLANWTPDLSDHIYHFTNVAVSGNNAMYVTTESVHVSSESKNIQVDLPEDMQVDIQSEQPTDEAVIVISVSPIDTPEEIELEEDQSAQTMDVHLYGIAESNDIPYTLTCSIPDGKRPAKLIYLSGSVENELVIETGHGPSNGTDTGLTYVYDPESGILEIQSVQQGPFTLIYEAVNETEE